MKPEILIVDDFLKDHAELFAVLQEAVRWDESMAARKTASFGVPYNYSQMSYPAAPMHPALVPVVVSLQERLDVSFNNCLLNYYETGENRMGFHSDDTSDLVEGSGVAIISLGTQRDITYRKKDNKEIQVSFALKPGSLLYMDSILQTEWTHAIKKDKCAGTRISLTWRAFSSDG